MQLITLDFETYYDKEYTLKKLTTEEYIRHSKFKVHCMGSKINAFPATCSFGDALAISKSAVLCHHAHFDGFILTHHYGVRPAFYFDTLSMARLALPHLKSHSLSSLAQNFGLGEKTVPYNLFMGKSTLSEKVQKLLEEGCKHDVELTYQIFTRLLPLVSQEELKVIDLTIRMFTEPALQLDKERMNVYLQKTIDDKAGLLSRVGVDEKELASSAKFSKILLGLGIEPPTKVSPRTGKEIYALAKTDEGFKALCDSPNELVSSLCAARLGIKSTLAESRAQRLIDAASRGPLPVYLKYYGAHTGRWSGGDGMNWQNFPRGGEIRKSILASNGMVLVVIDLAQIECRMVNWLAGQQEILEAFKLGRDIYCEAASRFYGRVITKSEKLERQIFKSVELGCGYGMGAEKFKSYAKAAGSPVDDAQARELITFYRHTHDRVCAYWRAADRIIDCMATGHKTQWGPMIVAKDVILYPNGGYTMYPGLEKADGRWTYDSKQVRTKLYGGRLVENVTQALSRVLLSQAMLKIAERYKIVMSTHDEVVYLAPEKEAKEAYDFGVNVFTTPPDWCKDIPLAAEGGYDKRYSK